MEFSTQTLANASATTLMTFKGKLYLMPFIVVMVLPQSCHVSCADNAVEEYFDYHFSTIEKQLNYSTVIAGEPMYSILAMEKVTSIESSVQYGDVSLYRNPSDYEVDKKKWTEWLYTEGCNLSVTQLNEIDEELETKNRYLID